MRNPLTIFWESIVWGLFFVTTVYGHVAMKTACGNAASYDYRRALTVVSSLQGVTALASWMISSFLWMVILTKHSVVAANTISSLRYLFIGVAAILFLDESINSKQAMGMILIAVGVAMASRSI